jgi:hypothetical protein
MKTLFLSLLSIALALCALPLSANAARKSASEITAAKLVHTPSSETKAAEATSIAKKALLIVVYASETDKPGRKLLNQVASFYSSKKAAGKLAALYLSQDPSEAAMSKFIKGLPLAFAGIHQSKASNLTSKVKRYAAGAKSCAVLIDDDDNVIAVSKLKDDGTLDWSDIKEKCTAGGGSPIAAPASTGTASRSAPGGANYPLDLTVNPSEKEKNDITIVSAFIVEPAEYYAVQKAMSAARDKDSARNAKFSSLESATAREIRRPPPKGAKNTEKQRAQASFEKVNEPFNEAKEKALVAAAEKGKPLPAPFTLTEKPAPRTYILYTWRRSATPVSGGLPVVLNGITYEPLARTVLTGTSGVTFSWRDFGAAPAGKK